jgi:Tfp pilus assembly protein PilX
MTMSALHQRQRGAALATALCLMLAVLSIGVCAARTALNAEKSALIERDRHIALLAADAALADAELDIAGGADPASARAAALAGGSAASFVPGCGRGGANLGLCAPAAPAKPPVWQAADLAGDSAVPYGRFTGAAMPLGGGLLPARAPGYVIERVPFGATGNLYRITAIGFGTRASTRVVVQSWYRTTSAAGERGAALPGERIGWREVANWPELHQAVQ